MWELSYRHSCATCRYSRKNGSIAAGSPGSGGKELFPLLENLLCLFCRESLGEPSVQAVLVRPDGRCPAYECDEGRYLAEHGRPPEEDEALFALVPPAGGKIPAFYPNL